MMKRIRCRDWMDTDGFLWIVSPEYNTLLQVDKSTKTVRAEVFLEKYLSYEMGECYLSGALSGEYIVCIPSASKDLVVYSLRDKNICYIPIKDPARVYKEIYNPGFKFFRGYVYDGCVLLFSGKYPALIHLNLKTRRVDYLNDWVIEAEKVIPQGDTRFYFGDGYARRKTELFLPMNCCGAFLSLELKTLHYRFVFTPELMQGIEGVTLIEDELCFIGRKEERYYLCLWNPDTSEMRKLQIFCQDGNPGWISFLSPIYWKSKVYLTPQMADHFYVADLKSGEICIEEHLDKMLSEFPEDLQDMKIGAVKQRGNEVTFHTWWDYKWHTYNLDTWEQEDFELHFEDADYTRRHQKALCHRLTEEGAVIPEEIVPFLTFLDEVKNRE